MTWQFCVFIYVVIAAVSFAGLIYSAGSEAANSSSDYSDFKFHLEAIFKRDSVQALSFAILLWPISIVFISVALLIVGLFELLSRIYTRVLWLIFRKKKKNEPS